MEGKRGFSGTDIVPKKRDGRAAAVTLAACVVLFGGPAVAWWVPRELAQWQVARALEHGAHGRFDLAEAAFAKAIAWDRDHPDTILRRAELRRAHGDLTGALSDYERVSELLPRQIELQYERTETRVRLGDFEEALQELEATADQMRQEWEDAETERRPANIAAASLRYAQALNSLAYTRARAGRNLQQGLDEINTAFDRLGGLQPDFMLDTRGYLHYLLGNYREALHDMEHAVAQSRDRYNKTMNQLRWHRRLLVDPQEIDDELSEHRHGMAVMYYHLGLARQAAGQGARARADLIYAKELGYSPEAGVW